MGTMRPNLLGAFTALALGLAGGGLLGGCGSSTKTVSATNPSEVAQTSAASTTPTTKTTRTSTTPASTATSTTPAQTTTSGGASAPTTTRTAAEPAFSEQETHAEGVSQAAALVRARGYTPNDTSEYHPEQALRVLLATKTGSSEGYGQQAFFFVNGRYIGTDTKEPSATVKVVSQSDTEVALAYTLYRKGDSLSSPTGGQAIVHFQLNNGKLTALQPIPPASSATGLARN
jgi:hypothetical protein